MISGEREIANIDCGISLLPAYKKATRQQGDLLFKGE